MVTAERFAQGMTFDQYVAYVATPENLEREASMDRPRQDWSKFLKSAFETARLTEAQEQGFRWLASQPGGPAKVLVISEEWSSDCRRDVPMVARVAAVAGLELRIFTRDGQRYGKAPAPDPAESPNADLMMQFLNRKKGQTWQSIPVVAFFTRDMQPLYHYVELPAIYHKDRIVWDTIRAPKPGESPEQTRARADREFGELQQSPFFRVWASAAVDEMLSMLYTRLRVGSLT
jgi:hypothetical protein